ncbi:MAG: radical SAM protein, partial [Oscillospiraceae bacterium]|nr:radical SAM protein [Oscillospiraceae bacterium]
MSTVITAIDHRSPAERAGVRTGERLVSIGGHAVEDVLDYRFFGYDRDPELVLESPDGSRRTVRVKKPEAAELGLNFETYLMDEPR